VAGAVRRLSRAIGVVLPVSLLLLTGAGTAPLAGCGGPRYPSCDKDEQCNTDGHKGVCVEHLCTECRDDRACSVGQTCTNGACADIPDYCDEKHACPEGSTCGDDNRCKKVPKVIAECDDNRACPGGAHCENDHCVTPPAGGPGCTSFPAVHFDYDSRDLPPDARSVLQRLAGCVTTGSLKGAKVLLTGHCDPRGEYEFNMVLGAERAENVKTLLGSLGVSESKMTTSSRGKLDAVGTDEGSWAQDRRVDIEIR
jgi:peptidoglycan-associated lipoprotein